ncbi:MAG: hypothetical protein GY866_09990 [Proteobacteria bacterium]|nr:hypothetical protein [Pseudomonadota bacterium]
MKNILILFLLLALSLPAYGNPFSKKGRMPEKYYQKIWCDQNNGIAEYRLKDKTRVDCLNNTHAVEVDFGKKWAEAIGQSLYYSLQTGKKAGILLIVDDPKERRFWIRLNSTIEHFKLPIDTWMIEKE